MPQRVLVPLPDCDFDVTEVVVPWKHLSDLGIEVIFATENGDTPSADPRLLRGVIFGQLGAEDEPKRLYELLRHDEKFRKPISWPEITATDFDGLVLPGGHAPGMRQYLSSTLLQEKVAHFAALDRPLGAICHGVVVLARSRDPHTGRSVIANRRTTCLPKFMERGAFYATAWRLGRYYRTYRAYVQDEVVSALDSPHQFSRGPRSFRRDDAAHDTAGFCVTDGTYVSARWPGDAYTFAARFGELLGH